MGYNLDEPRHALLPEDADPATAARNAQGTPIYTGTDRDWHNVAPVRKGELLVQTANITNGRAEPSKSPFFTRIETLNQSGGDAYAFATPIQVGAGRRSSDGALQRGQYRDGVVVYQLQEELDGVAEGTATQNPQFGSGKGTQLYTRGKGGERALNPKDNPEYFKIVGIIPMTHTSSPVDLRGLTREDRRGLR